MEVKLISNEKDNPMESREFIKISIGDVKGEYFVLNYDLLEKTKALTEKHYISLWNYSEKMIPWDTVPEETFLLESDDVRGSIVLTPKQGISVDEYVVGYSSASIKETIENNICAMAIISPTKKFSEVALEHSLYLELNMVLKNQVSIKCNGLEGYVPYKTLNWLALWEGRRVGAKENILNIARNELNRSSGSVTFKGCNLIRGKYYTIGYFMDGWNEEVTKRKMGSLAASLTFYICD